MIQSNEVTKNDFNIDRSGVSCGKQNEVLLKKKKTEFGIAFFDFDQALDKLPINPKPNHF